MKSQRAPLVFIAVCGLWMMGSILSGLQSRAEIDRRAHGLSVRLEASQAPVERGLGELRRLEEHEHPTDEIELDRIARELDALGEQVAQLRRETPGAQSASSVDAARPSVALLLVGYGLYDKDTGRSWRVVSVDEMDPSHPDGEGGPADDRTDREAYYTTGTGFVIGGNQIVTNRHVAQPWWRDYSGQAAIERGYEPRYTVLQAYFPGEPQPLELEVTAVSPEADVAILTTATPISRPPLRLATSGPRPRAGERIVVISYPAGVAGLLARADEADAEDLRVRADDREPDLVHALAREDLIRPLVTVGYVGDVLPGRLIYDAATALGSSGGPVLNAAGQVIAVNYGSMSDFAGASFGVPARFVRGLLETELGVWKNTITNTNMETLAGRYGW